MHPLRVFKSLLGNNVDFSSISQQGVSVLFRLWDMKTMLLFSILQGPAHSGTVRDDQHENVMGKVKSALFCATAVQNKSLFDVRERKMVKLHKK